MALSPEQIANRALALLGISPIVSFADETKKAEIIRNSFDSLERMVFEDADWTFATKRGLAPLSSDEDPWKRGYYFDLPTDDDIVRVISATSDPFSDIPLKWRREQDQLYTEEIYNQLYIRYTILIEDTTLWPAYFEQALVYACAVEWCMPLTENRTTRDRYAEEYAVYIEAAAMKENSQGSREEYWSKKTQVVR